MPDLKRSVNGIWTACAKTGARETMVTVPSSGNCKQQMVIYNLHCKCCGKDYVGKTQNHLRKRTDTHYCEAWLGVKGHFKDSFARHVAGHCKDLTSSNASTRWCHKTSSLLSFAKERDLNA
jgi:hypothetical protein